MFLAFGSAHLALCGLWIGLTLSLVYSSIVGLYICLQTDWHKEVHKVESRLVAGDTETKAAVGVAHEV